MFNKVQGSPSFELTNSLNSNKLGKHDGTGQRFNAAVGPFKG